MEYKYKLNHIEIAKRIKEARKAAGLTQAALAEKINISTNAVAKLEVNLKSTNTDKDRQCSEYGYKLSFASWS